ncbi:hypothetical protein PDE_02681 [Penicillium oxalicum 114-2]|uniref:RTA1 like protein n=1 Tax=Penicillium oxalicum (strain 114-2 / CGMCC 5302) TaxID=933388 RepID=S8B099_PENO1|nr:hypothetical protein PDE_02681 [Penicillium oxalicum 114-2]
MSNFTIPSKYCTLDTCPITKAHVFYVPSLAGNTLYVALFATLLIAQIALVVRYRTWGYFAGVFGGLVLEVVGYLGRIQMHNNPFLFTPFLEYLICLTIAPAFLSASIYICLGRIVKIYGKNISRLRPRTYTLVFVGCDLVSLILQAAGGAITSIADSDQYGLAQSGIHIMIAGLSFQVASLALFMGLCLDFAWQVSKKQHELSPDVRMQEVRESALWKAFLGALAIATVTIFVRSAFRVAELNGGFHSALANDQVLFMILEGAMIAIATICMTVLHPGICFKGLWDATKWSFRRARQSELQLPEVGLEHKACP